MALRARDLVLAACVSFVAWGYLTSWAPILRLLGYTFVAGASVVICALLTLVLLTSKNKNLTRDVFSGSHSSVAFITPEAWKEENAFLTERKIFNKPPLYPPSFVVNEAIDGLLDQVLQIYITSWYRNISKSLTFVNQINFVIRTALIEIQSRISRIDIVEKAVARIVPLITTHLKDFYEAERIVRGKNLNRNVTESEELDLAIAAKYRDGKLHPAASLAYADLKLVQQQYLRRMVERLLPMILPEMVIKSGAVYTLIKEIVSCAVLTPLMQMLSEPDTWNQLMEAYGRTMLQDRKTVQKMRAALDQHASPIPKARKTQAFPKIVPGDDERRFERFVRFVRQCNNLSEARRFRSEIASQLKRESITETQDQVYLRRLHTGKNLLDQRVAKLSAVGGSSHVRMPQPDFKTSQNVSRLLNASLREVLQDASGLSYFMEFMDRQRRMTLVQFWVVVDGFRNPLEEDTQLEDTLSGHQTRWTESDRMDLAQISEAYLSRPELHVSEESQALVQAFLRAGSSATLSQYQRARSVVLKTQSSTFNELEEIHFPNFKRSDLYFKYLASDDVSFKVPSKAPSRAVKEPSVTSIPESPGKSANINHLASRSGANTIDLKRNAASSNDLRSSAAGKLSDNAESMQIRRSLDIDTSAPLFDDDIDDERLAKSTQSLDQDSINGDQNLGDQAQMVEAMEAALTNIIHDDPKIEPSKDGLFEDFRPDMPASKALYSPRSSDELKRPETSLHDKDKERPNLASLGLVNTSSRIGVFSDNDLFDDEEKFLEDEQTDPDMSVEERPIDDEIHEAAPGDLGLAEAISALTVDIERLASQDSVVDTLTRKAELTNNIAELRILGKSKSSLQREIRRKELQRQQYIVQESDNSLYGRANVNIKSLMVGKEDDGQEFALYVIEVHRRAGENLPAASWAVARRYSEFHDLHQRLRSIYPAVRHLDFPRRRLVMKLQRDFLHKRKISLEHYLCDLLRLPAVCRSRDLRAFLSQSAIISSTDSAPDGDRQDIISRIYSSVTDGMDEFLGNVPVLDQLSIAGQNLISAATSQFNSMALTQSDIGDSSLPISPEDPIQSAEARAELFAFEPNANSMPHADQFEPFVKPICDIFLEAFDLQRGNNWLRGRAVVVVLHQLLGGTVERKVREMARSLLAESAVIRYINALKDLLMPHRESGEENATRTKAEKARSKTEANVMLATLIPDLAGSVVGKANAQAASRRLAATVNNGRLNAHLTFVILDEIVSILYPMEIPR